MPINNVIFENDFLEKYREDTSDERCDDIEKDMIDDFEISKFRKPLMHNNDTNSNKLRGMTNEKKLYKNWTFKLKNHKTDLTLLQFQQYSKISKLGRGGFGEVSKIIHRPTKQICAMKKIDITSLRSNCNKLDVILNEVAIMKTLNHKNIIHLFHYYLLPHKELDLILEYCQHGSLRHFIRNHTNCRLSELECIQCTIQIMDGLEYLFNRNIVHGDIKAANILLCDNGILKLCDFGLSFNSESIEDNNNHTNNPFEVNGSAYWLAPEVIRMQGVSHKSDIWSLGATIIEMLTGEPPFAKYGALPACHAIGSGQQIKYPNNIGKDCEKFLTSCFKFNPSERPNVKELRRYEWLKKGSKRQLLQFVEIGGDYDDYERGFDFDSFKKIEINSEKESNSKLKSKLKLKSYEEDNTNFTNDFEFEDNLARQERIIRNFPHVSLHELKSFGKVNEESVLNLMKEINFLSVMIAHFSDPHKSKEFKNITLSLGNQLFERHPLAMLDFCYLGGLPVLLGCHGLEELKYFIKLIITKLDTGVDYFLVAGGMSALNKLSDDELLQLVHTHDHGRHAKFFSKEE